MPGYKINNNVFTIYLFVLQKLIATDNESLGLSMEIILSTSAICELNWLSHGQEYNIRVYFKNM